MKDISTTFMTDKEFDKIFREKLQVHNEPVDDSIWAAIESSLDKQVAARRIIRRVGYYTVSAAAVVLLAVFLFRPDNQPYIQSEEQIAIFEQPIEKTNALADKSDNIAKEAESDGYMEDTGFEKETGSAAGKTAVKQEVLEIAEKGEMVAGVVDTEVTKDKSDAKDLKVPQGNREYQTLTAWNDVDWEDDNKNGKQGYSVSLFSNVNSGNNVAMTPSYMSVMSAGGVSHSTPEMQGMEIISEAKYALPVNIGIQGQIKVASFLSVGFGVGYTWLSSRYEALVAKKYYHVKQNLHYIGIPVNVYFTLLDKRNLYLYANVGGAVEKGIKASYTLTDYEGVIRETSAKIDGFQYSANAGIGLEYRFIDKFGLYIEPNVVYYINSHIPASIRTDQPLQIKAEIGLRFHIR